MYQLHGVTRRKTVSSKFGSLCLTFKEAHIQVKLNRVRRQAVYYNVTLARSRNVYTSSATITA